MLAVFLFSGCELLLLLSSVSNNARTGNSGTYRRRRRQNSSGRVEGFRPRPINMILTVSRRQVKASRRRNGGRGDRRNGPNSARSAARQRAVRRNFQLTAPMVLRRQVSDRTCSSCRRGPRRSSRRVNGGENVRIKILVRERVVTCRVRRARGRRDRACRRARGLLECLFNELIFHL